MRGLRSIGGPLVLTCGSKLAKPLICLGLPNAFNGGILQIEPDGTQEDSQYRTRDPLRRRKTLQLRALAAFVPLKPAI